MSERITSGQRCHPFRSRIIATIGVLSLLAAVQILVLMIRVSHPTTRGSPKFLANLLAISAPLSLVTLAGVLLWRGLQRNTPILVSGFGSLGFLFLGTANWMATIQCNHTDPPMPAGLPEVNVWILEQSISGFLVPFPELTVLRPFGGFHCTLTPNLGIVGVGFLLVAGWLWLGRFPGQILDWLETVRP